jgi:hypothetical protein
VVEDREILRIDDDPQYHFHLEAVVEGHSLNVHQQFEEAADRNEVCEDHM